MRRWERARRGAGLVGPLLVAVLVLAGCGQYDGATKQAEPMRDLYNLMFAVATFVFVLVEALILWAALRYRRKRGDEGLPPQFHGNNFLEVTWTVIPLAIVLVLFVLSFQVINEVNAEAKNPDVTVNVIGFQWQWRFTYRGEPVQVEEGQPPQDLSIRGTITKPPHVYLPVGEKIHFNLQGQDVIHSFYIPEFLFKRDTVPGRDNSFEITITKPGVYHGQCAQFCGLQHNSMHFYIHAVDRPAYERWLQTTKKQAASGCPEDTSPGKISADKSTFDKECLAQPAGRPFTVEFENKEPVDHNVHFFRGRTPDTESLTPPAELAPFPGPKTVTYSLPALQKGTYFYRCDVHPAAMTGNLVVR